MNEKQNSSPKDFDGISYHYEEIVNSAVQQTTGESSDYYLKIKAAELVKHLEYLECDVSRLDVLDVGCGTGQLVNLLFGKFHSVKGIEPSRGMLAKALSRRLADDTFEHGYAEDIPFDDACFDVVFSSCIFHHTPKANHGKMVVEMSRVLKPGGWIFTFEHNPFNPLTRWIVSHCPVDVGVTLHRCGHIEKVCREAGLLQVHSRYIVFFPRLFKYFRAFEQSLYKLPIGGQYYTCARKPISK